MASGALVSDEIVIGVLEIMGVDSDMRGIVLLYSTMVDNRMVNDGDRVFNP